MRSLVGRYRAGPWLRSGRFEHGLLFPGRPQGRAFDLLLAPDAAVLRGSSDLELPWSAHLDFTKDGLSSAGWCLDGWSHGQGESWGFAIRLLGDLEHDSSALPLMRTWTVRRHRQDAWGASAPLHRQVLPAFAHQADRDAVRALCTALVGRPEARARLADKGVVTQLVALMAEAPHTRVGAVDGVRRKTIDVTNALRALGLTHPIGGRPLPGQLLPTADELLPAVLGHLRSSAYARATEPDHDRVRKIINEVYSSPQPWPFEPLFDEPRSPHADPSVDEDGT